MKKPTPAQLAARAKFAAAAKAGTLKRKTKKAATRRKANPAPSIKVGDYVRSYDFPGMHDDHYLEGVVTKIGNGVYSITVSRRVVGGEEKPIPASLRQVQAPIDPHFMTGVYGVQKLERNPNPARRKKTVSEKISQLVREGYPQKQAVAVALNEERAGKVKRNPATGSKKSGTKLNPATGSKKSRTKLNPARDFYYVVKCGQYYDGQFSSKHYTLDEVKKIAQQKADKYGCPAKITEIH